MERPYRILILEDMPSDWMLIKREVKKVIGSCDFIVMDNKEEFIEGLNEFRPDIILSDYCIPGFDWYTAYQLAMKYSMNIPFIIVSGSANPEIAKDCLKAGANDFINKDNMKALGPALLHYYNRNRNTLAC
jgi:CheY-like chemotaxis protein